MIQKTLDQSTGVQRWVKSPFLMGTSTISMAMFNSFLLVHQAGYQPSWPSWWMFILSNIVSNFEPNPVPLIAETVQLVAQMATADASKAQMKSWKHPLKATFKMSVKGLVKTAADIRKMPSKASRTCYCQAGCVSQSLSSVPQQSRPTWLCVSQYNATVAVCS